MMEQKSSLDQTSLESFFFQISYVPPGEYGGRHLLEACPRHVSVHALLAECDRPMPAVMCLTGCFNPRTPCGVRHHGCAIESRTGRFQSTHSLRSATTTLHNAKAETNVSIHALLAECDRGFCSRGMNFCGFNPRTPCGVRPNPCKDHPVLLLFQSTHSLRSATDLRRDLADMRRVSIHALLAECDLSVRSPLFFSDSFNPRTPCGVRPYNA